MQGWRKNMEDARITLLSVPGPNNKSYAIFGVFDGHGGNWLASFRGWSVEIRGRKLRGIVYEVLRIQAREYLGGTLTDILRYGR